MILFGASAEMNAGALGGGEWPVAMDGCNGRGAGGFLLLMEMIRLDKLV